MYGTNMMAETTPNNRPPEERGYNLVDIHTLNWYVCETPCWLCQQSFVAKETLTLIVWYRKPYLSAKDNFQLP